MTFFAERLLQIEITKDKNKVRVYFPKMPMTEYRTPNMVEKIYLETDRSSSQAKIESLMTLTDDIIHELEAKSLYLNNPLFKRVETLSVLSRYEELFKDYTLTLILVYHIFIVIKLDTNGDTRDLPSIISRSNRESQSIDPE